MYRRRINYLKVLADITIKILHMGGTYRLSGNMDQHLGYLFGHLRILIYWTYQGTQRKIRLKTKLTLDFRIKRY